MPTRIALDYQDYFIEMFYLYNHDTDITCEIPILKLREFFLGFQGQQMSAKSLAEISSFSPRVAVPVGVCVTSVVMGACKVSMRTGIYQR